MTSLAFAVDPSVITPAWRSLQRTLPVRLAPIRNEAQYRSLIGLLNGLVDVIGDDETHELADFLDLVGELIADYERDQHPIPDAPPGEVLRFLMEQQGLTPADLSAELGEPPVVAAILQGSREMNIQQARALAERFGVSPAVFIVSVC
jgi:HTH-type transcriptional regulator/antitoxin HigA